MGGAGLLVLAAEPLPACSVILPSNQVHFRKAVHVYTATAIDEGHAYRVDRVWRGSEAEIVVLSLPMPFGCEPHAPSEPGRSYLLTIACEWPNAAGIYDCPRDAAPLDGAETRLRYLQHAIPTRASDVVEMVERWTTGTVGDVELARWVADRRELAEVDDWVETGSGDATSPTLTVLQGIDDLVIGGKGAERLRCEFEHLERAAPFLSSFLKAPTVTESMVEVVEETFDRIHLDCG